MLNNFFYIYIKAYFSNGKAGDILMFNSNAVWRVFHYPLPSHVSVKNQKLSWATATGPFSKPISTCQSKAMNSGEHLDDPCRNSAFCFFMFSVSCVRSNKTFYFSLLNHEIGTFSPQNKLFFLLYFFLHNSLLIHEKLQYTPCVEFWSLRGQLRPCQNPENHWGLIRPVDGCVLRRAEQKKRILLSLPL